MPWLYHFATIFGFLQSFLCAASPSPSKSLLLAPILKDEKRKKHDIDSKQQFNLRCILYKQSEGFEVFCHPNEKTPALSIQASTVLREKLPFHRLTFVYWNYQQHTKRTTSNRGTVNLINWRLIIIYKYTLVLTQQLTLFRGEFYGFEVRAWKGGGVGLVGPVCEAMALGESRPPFLQHVHGGLGLGHHANGLSESGQSSRIPRGGLPLAHQTAMDCPRIPQDEIACLGQDQLPPVLQHDGIARQHSTEIIPVVHRWTLFANRRLGLFAWTFGHYLQTSRLLSHVIQRKHPYSQTMRTD